MCRRPARPLLMALLLGLALTALPGCGSPPEVDTVAATPAGATASAPAAAPAEAAPSAPAAAPAEAAPSAAAPTPATGSPGAEATPMPTPSSVPPGPLARIVDSGRLRIGTSGEQPPLSMTTQAGDLIGLDVALGTVLARTMGVEPAFVVAPFGTLLDRLAAGEVDVVISGLAITARRMVRAEFSGPYYTSGKAVLSRRADLQAASSTDALDLPGLTVAALAGSTSESFAREELPGATILATTHLEEAIALVLGGGADALVADRETCHYALLRHPDAGLLPPLHTFTVEPMGVAVSRDAPRLARLIDTYLQALDQRGVLERLRRFWLEDPSWVGAVR